MSGMVQSTCLCESSPPEFIPLKEFLTADITKGSNSDISLIPQHIDPVQTLFDVIYFNYVTPERKVCADTVRFLSYISNSKYVFTELKGIVCSNDPFAQYAGATLLASILLTSPDGYEEHLNLLSKQLYKTDSFACKIGLLTLFEKIIQQKSKHAFETTNVSSATFQACSKQVVPPALDCSARHFAMKITALMLPKLLESQLLLFTQSCNQVDDDLLDTGGSVHENAEVVVQQILRLWLAVVESRIDEFLFTEMNWKVVIESTTILSSPTVNLLLNVLDKLLDYSYYQLERCPVPNGLLELASHVLQFEETNILEIPSCDSSTSWGFSGPVNDPNVVASRFVGNPALPKVVSLILKALAFLKDQHQNECYLNSLHVLSLRTREWNSNWMIRLFIDQDDALIEAFICTLDIYIEKKNIPSVEFLNPFNSFATFVVSVNYDHEVFLDFLTSDDTNFLLFFTRYLKFLQVSLRNGSFGQSFDASSKLVAYSDSESDENTEQSSADSLEECEVSTQNERVFTMFDKLQTSLVKLQMKNLLTFNPTPLVKLLGKCVELYAT